MDRIITIDIESYWSNPAQSIINVTQHQNLQLFLEKGVDKDIVVILYNISPTLTAVARKFFQTRQN